MRRILLLLAVVVAMTAMAGASALPAGAQAGGIGSLPDDECQASGGIPLPPDPFTGEPRCELPLPPEPPPPPPQFDPPKVTINAPADGAVFFLGQQVAFDFRCEPSDPDPRAQVSTCVGLQLVGDSRFLPVDRVLEPDRVVFIDTTTVGTKTVRAVGTSFEGQGVGESTVVDHTYQVIDPALCPQVDQPAQAADGAKAKGGGTLPPTGGISPLVTAGASAVGVLLLGAGTLVGRRLSR